MLIGLNYIGATVMDNTLPFSNTYYNVELKNCIIDELIVDTKSNYLDKTKQNWGLYTLMLARFKNDYEAGNINPNEMNITGWRIKRKPVDAFNYDTIVELPMNINTVQEYEDNQVRSKTNYNYLIVPLVDGIEADPVLYTVFSDFGGWWLIDPDDLSNAHQFYYNLDDVSVTTEEDRVEMSTFAKYPIVRYGNKRAKKGTLSAVFIPNEDTTETVYQQVSKLENIISQHKPLLLKSGSGHNYLVDISDPQETMYTRPSGLSKITLNWLEVGEAPQ